LVVVVLEVVVVLAVVVVVDFGCSVNGGRVFSVRMVHGGLVPVPSTRAWLVVGWHVGSSTAPAGGV
jgi:hypothetical protein